MLSENINISFLSCRRGIAPITKEGSIIVGRSFKECTAISALFSLLKFMINHIIYSSISTDLVKTPIPPIWCKGCDWFTSPIAVFTSIISKSSLVKFSSLTLVSKAIISWVWTIANWELRVASLYLRRWTISILLILNWNKIIFTANNLMQ